MPYVKLSHSHQNVELFYEVHGSGEIKILFIIGLLTDSGAWICQTEFFREQHAYQCVIFDNRGCGRSSTPRTLQYTTTQMAKDALALIEHLHWHQCHVVGVSMGGMIGLELALLAPHKLLSLSVLATHAGGLCAQAPLVGIRHLLRSVLIRDEDLQIQNALEMLYSQKTLANPDRRKYFYDYHTKRIRNCIPPTIIGVLGQILAVQTHYISYGDLLKIRYSPITTLIIVGTEDRLVRETNSYMLQRVLGCRLIKLEHAGHGLSRECAQEINTVLLNLFESFKEQNLSDSPKSNDYVSIDYEVEIEALQHCCQHRTHCFIHLIISLLKGSFLGFLFYFMLTIGVNKHSFIDSNLAFRCTVLMGCISGFRQAIMCVYHAFRARHFAHKHKLILEEPMNENVITFSKNKRNGIPNGCGFEFPNSTLFFVIVLFIVTCWMRQLAQS